MLNGSIYLGCSFVLKKVTNTKQYISLSILDVLQKVYFHFLTWYPKANTKLQCNLAPEWSCFRLQESLRRRRSKERATTDWCQMSLSSSQLWALYECVDFVCIWPLSTCWAQDDRFALGCTIDHCSHPCPAKTFLILFLFIFFMRLLIWHCLDDQDSHEKILIWCKVQFICIWGPNKRGICCFLLPALTHFVAFRVFLSEYWKPSGMEHKNA